MPVDALSARLPQSGFRLIMSGAADPVSTQPVGKGGPPTPRAQSANDPSSVNSTPPQPEHAASSNLVLYSEGSSSGTPVQAAAAGSGRTSGGVPQATPQTPTALEEDSEDDEAGDPDAD